MILGGVLHFAGEVLYPQRSARGQEKGVRLAVDGSRTDNLSAVVDAPSIGQNPASAWVDQSTEKRASAAGVNESLAPGATPDLIETIDRGRVSASTRSDVHHHGTVIEEGTDLEGARENRSAGDMSGRVYGVTRTGIVLCGWIVGWDNDVCLSVVEGGVEMDARKRKETRLLAASDDSEIVHTVRVATLAAVAESRFGTRSVEITVEAARGYVGHVRRP